jgi:hypothetical protein
MLTDWLRDTFGTSQDEQYANLLGAKAEPEMGPMRPGVDVRQMAGGSGFLGSDQAPADQSRFIQGLLGADYSTQQTSLLMEPFVLDAAVKNDLEVQKQKEIYAAQMGMGQFNSPNEYATQMQKLSDRHKTAMDPFRQASLGYNQVKGLMRNTDGSQKKISTLGGVFDLALQRNFIKGMSVLRPEAYMSDDAVQTFMAAENLDSWEQLTNYFAGDINLSKEGRGRMIRAYDSIMKDNFDARDKVENPYLLQKDRLFPNTDSAVIFGEKTGDYGGLVGHLTSQEMEDFVPDPKWSARRTHLERLDFQARKENQ